MPFRLILGGCWSQKGNNYSIILKLFPYNILYQIIIRFKCDAFLKSVLHQGCENARKVVS